MANAMSFCPLLAALWALSPTASAAEEPALFAVKVQVHQVDEGASVVPPGTPRPELVGTSASFQEEVSLDLSYEAGPGLQPLRSSASTRYAWRRSLVNESDSSPVREEKGEEAGTELLDWDASIERDFRPLACEDLIVHDQMGGSRESRSADSGLGARSPEVRLRFRATWPGKVTLRDISAGVAPFDSETLPSLEVSQSFRYELASSESARQVSLVAPSPAADEVAGATRRTTVELTISPVAPHEFGLVARVAPDGTPALLNRVVVGGRDLSGALRVRRMQRIWAVRSGAGGTASYELASDWRVFSNEAGLPVPPELFQESLGAASGPERSWLVEFLEMVEDVPELGFLYHTVSMETRSQGPRFHFLASEARSVSPSTWCDIRSGSYPGIQAPAVASRGPLRTIAEANYGNYGIANR